MEFFGSFGSLLMYQANSCGRPARDRMPRSQPGGRGCASSESGHFLQQWLQAVRLNLLNIHEGVVQRADAGLRCFFAIFSTSSRTCFSALSRRVYRPPSLGRSPDSWVASPYS